MMNTALKISFPTDERAVAATIAAAQSSRLVLNAFADVFQVDGKNAPTQRPMPTKTNRRRPSIPRIMKRAKELGYDIAIAPDGTTRLIAGPDSESSKNWWDGKLK